MTQPPDPDWRARLRAAAFRPITAGAKRAFITLLAISFAIGAANLLFTAREVGSTRHALTASQHAAASVTQLCQSGNDARAQQLILWDHIITISAPPARETPAQQRRRLATLRAFEAYIHHVFAPRNCHAITH